MEEEVMEEEEEEEVTMIVEEKRTAEKLKRCHLCNVQMFSPWHCFYIFLTLK